MSDDSRTRLITPQSNVGSEDSTPKTRLVGGGMGDSGATQIVGNQSEYSDVRTRMVSGHAPSSEDKPSEIKQHDLAVGWVVVVEGPGRGCTKEIFYGMNSIGRGLDERIPLDFGDTSISRDSHAYIVFDEKQCEFYIQHGGKSNLVRLNDTPVLAPATLNAHDMIELGETKLMFIPLCGDGFKWEDSSN